MTIVTISPETCEIEVREGFSLALPKFLWTVLEARAKALHKGDLHTLRSWSWPLSELMEWFSEAIKDVVGPVSGNN
jgi:hypothetical protein